ncbi:uncharacterized protein CLUP02_18187 [Colletotrichum lupini]|uniref:Uncharacterized protein n=1 Tax=Colletotrichum lupini TaxID=145971 RepID=A0A9Q8WAJ1_9PEZI|nr:uncharacterized protein CLUP02_18187 [Colletotrichum lupini]UQC76673.1 hypothetical protein CLUP02_18187 [Colletotrichum lupini]
MTTLQRPGWTPMAQIPPDQTNRGGDGWRGLDWWDSPTRVADTPVCTRLSSLPTGRGLQMVMDGGMRLATGVCGQRPSCAVSVTLCAAPPAFRMLCCQAENVSSSTFVYICYSLWRTKSPTTVTWQYTYTITARTAATVRDRSVCPKTWKPSPTSTETKTVLRTDRALRETTAGVSAMEIAVGKCHESRFYTIQSSFHSTEPQRASSRYVGRPVVNARWMPLVAFFVRHSHFRAQGLAARPPALSRSTIPSSNLWTTVKGRDRPAIAAQDSVRSAYDDGTGFHPRALEQLAMGIQDSYQSASMTFTLRRQTRIHLLSQLSQSAAAVDIAQREAWLAVGPLAVNTVIPWTPSPEGILPAVAQPLPLSPWARTWQNLHSNTDLFWIFANTPPQARLSFARPHAKHQFTTNDKSKELLTLAFA